LAASSRSASGALLSFITSRKNWRGSSYLMALATEFALLLQQHTPIGTGTTSGRLQSKVCLTVERLLSGPLGGDLQIGARLSVCDVPCATNLATARVLLGAMGREPS
jgi:methylglyoxal synthase